MKKLALFFMLASATVLTSCGSGGNVKLSPEVEAKASEAEEKIGSTAGDIVRLYAQCQILEDSLTHNVLEEKTFNDLERQLEETKEAINKNAEKLVQELSGKSIGRRRSHETDKTLYGKGGTPQ